jgi:Tfp pilus assembly protein PilN
VGTRVQLVKFLIVRVFDADSVLGAIFCIYVNVVAGPWQTAQQRARIVILDVHIAQAAIGGAVKLQANAGGIDWRSGGRGRRGRGRRGGGAGL